MKRAIGLVALVLVVVVTVACDQVTKCVARQALAGGSEYEVLGGVLTLVLAENEGAFLSLGANLPGGLRMAVASGLVVALVAVAGMVLWDRTSSTASMLAAALLVAGGGSNLVDRFCRHGRVTDFLLLRAGPLHSGVFNVADLAIMAGAVVFLWVTARKGAA